MITRANRNGIRVGGAALEIKKNHLEFNSFNFSFFLLLSSTSVLYGDRFILFWLYFLLYFGVVPGCMLDVSFV